MRWPQGNWDKEQDFHSPQMKERNGISARRERRETPRRERILRASRGHVYEGERAVGIASLFFRVLFCFVLFF